MSEKEEISYKDITLSEIKKLQKLMFNEYEKNGYLQEWLWVINSTGQKKLDIAELGLITTEISEAIEEIRNKNTDIEHLGEECADILIRTLNFMSRKGLDASYYILKKYQKNLGRGKLHGRAV